MDVKPVRQWRDKETVEALVLVKEKSTSLGKNGRPFMSLLLGDASGSIDSRLWDNVDDLSKEFDVGHVIKVKGQVQLFQNRRQFVVHRLERVDQSTVKVDDYLARHAVNLDDLYADLVHTVKGMRNEALKTLVLDTLEDPEIKGMLMKAPAAKSIHHAWRGGLLEHIHSITKMMEFLAAHYSFLNRDLLVFGAIFHDIGKLWELSYEQGIGYTDRGRLIGHMEMACELIDRKSSRILGFTQDLRDICKHIVLSHHGKLEYGSPKRPKFLEAFVVAAIDDLDSKISTIRGLIEAERGGDDRWSRYSELFDRYFLLDDLKEKY